MENIGALGCEAGRFFFMGGYCYGSLSVETGDMVGHLLHSVMI